MNKLKGIKVAILVCDGFEEVELSKPYSALKAEGAEVVIISPNKDKVKAWNFTDWSTTYDVDLQLEKAHAEDFDALLLPGGVINPDKLRTHEKAINFVNHFFKENKLIAAICHGPWTLIETKQLANRNLTSYHSIKTDLINAGAIWHDQEVVVDDGLITSRSPKDLSAFNEKIVEHLSKH